MFRVVREIHFNYGHRLLNYEGKCSHLHGHNARLMIELSSDKLNASGMVMDFYHIQKTIGSWVEENLDHKMVLSEKDPLAGILQEMNEPVVMMKENPTAEVLARWIFQEARKLRVPVSRVTLWESPDSSAVYHE